MLMRRRSDKLSSSSVYFYFVLVEEMKKISETGYFSISFCCSFDPPVLRLGQNQYSYTKSAPLPLSFSNMHQESLFVFRSSLVDHFCFCYLLLLLLRCLILSLSPVTKIRYIAAVTYMSHTSIRFWGVYIDIHPYIEMHAYISIYPYCSRTLCSCFYFFDSYPSFCAWLPPPLLLFQLRHSRDIHVCFFFSFWIYKGQIEMQTRLLDVQDMSREPTTTTTKKK